MITDKFYKRKFDSAYIDKEIEYYKWQIDHASPGVDTTLYMIKLAEYNRYKIDDEFAKLLDHILCLILE